LPISTSLNEKLPPSSMTTTAKRGYEIASLFPDRRVIIGGVHAPMLPEEPAQHADHVVVGECERVQPDLIAGRIKEYYRHVD
jgi:radical SAM superfamily enzyme YgiQ (UPF0313 family)